MGVQPRKRELREQLRTKQLGERNALVRTYEKQTARTRTRTSTQSTCHRRAHVHRDTRIPGVMDA